MAAIAQASASQTSAGWDLVEPAGATRAGASQEPLLVGAAKRSITPTVRGRRVYMAGHARGRLATEIHDELWVRAIALRYREVTLVLVSLDLLGLFHEYVESIRGMVAAAGIPADGLIVTCTGNHSGPDTLGLWGKGLPGLGLNVRYLDFLRTQIVQVIGLAVAAMEPAQAHMACAELAGHAGDVDAAETAVVQFRTITGKNLATVIEGSLVPQVLEAANTIISADFLNWLYLDLEHTSNDVIMYVCDGTADPALSLVRERSWGEAERIGYKLASMVDHAVQDAPPIAVDHLAVWRRPIAIPPDRGRLARPGNAGGRPVGEWHRESEVSLVELGPIRMLALPGLVTPDMGFELRKALDAPCRWLLCLSNDNLGTIRLEQELSWGQGLLSSRRRPTRGGTVPCVRVGSHLGTIVMDRVVDLMVEVRGSQAVVAR